MTNTSSLYDVFWSESAWFPVGVNGEKYGWKDLQSKPESNEHYPQAADLHFGVLIGALLVVLRYVLEKFLIIPIGIKFGIPKDKPVNLEPNVVLETAHQNNRRYVSDKLYQSLAKQTDMSVRQVEVWFRRRQKKDRPSPMAKFCNNSWHLVYYTVAFAYGTKVLWTKPWLWKTSECWTNWPHQPISRDLYWYYVMEFAFYWSLLITVFTDHKRKDFREMVLHHFVTIFLIYCSWTVNFVRLGSLVLLLHDASDPWLALSKMGIYLKIERLKIVAFTMFASVWFLSRLIYFPFWILNNTVVELYDVFSSPGLIHCVCNVFQFLLFGLNLMWSYRLYRMVYTTVTGGEIEDSRSDSEGGDDENENHEKPNGMVYTNGTKHNTLSRHG